MYSTYHDLLSAYNKHHTCVVCKKPVVAGKVQCKLHSDLWSKSQRAPVRGVTGQERFLQFVNSQIEPEAVSFEIAIKDKDTQAVIKTLMVEMDWLFHEYDMQDTIFGEQVLKLLKGYIV